MNFTCTEKRTFTVTADARDVEITGQGDAVVVFNLSREHAVMFAGERLAPRETKRLPAAANGLYRAASLGGEAEIRVSLGTTDP